MLCTRPRVLVALVCGAVLATAPIHAQSKTSSHPTSSSALSHAELLLTVGQYRTALTEFEAMLASDSNATVAWLGIGRAQERLGHAQDAAAAYQSYTRREPADAGGFELLGRALASLGRHPDALSAFRTAQRLDRASAQASLGAAASLRALGRREEALRVLRAISRAHPDESLIWGALASLSLDMDRGTLAASYWEQALRRDPGYFDERTAERARWEELMKTLGPSDPRADIAVSDAAPHASRRDSIMPARRDTTNAVVASPRYPRFATASISSPFVPGPTSSGTGFVVAREAGLVLTNKHVVRACGQVKVRVDAGKSRVAVVQALDADDDLALLRVSLPAGPSAAFRDDPAVRPGDDVVAVGFPLAGLLADQVNVSTGTVNALAGLYNDLHMLQMSAPVQPGSSGGALFDASGHVVGVVVTKLNARVVAEETGDIPQNVNFAVKATVARDFLKQQGVAVRTAPSGPTRSNADVGEIGRQVTLLVECWP